MKLGHSWLTADSLFETFWQFTVSWTGSKPTGNDTRVRSQILMFLEKMDTQLMPKPIWKHVKYGDKGAVCFSQFVACILVLYFGLNSDITQYFPLQWFLKPSISKPVFLTKINKYINTCHYRFLTHHSKNDANRHSTKSVHLSSHPSLLLPCLLCLPSPFSPPCVLGNVWKNWEDWHIPWRREKKKLASTQSKV